MMKVAIIGLGRWGKVLLGELKNLAEVKYECDSKTDLAEVFADPEIEAVFIATPTETHFEIARKAFEAGKHVFLEKPGTASSDDLAKLVEKAAEKKLKFAVGYEFPHHPATQKLKEIIKGKKIKSIYLEWQKWGTFKDNAVMHLLCHDVSVLKYLGFGNLSPLNHHRTKVISDTDIIWTEFDNDQNAYIKSTINRIAPIKQKTVTILTDNGGYVWNNNELFSINQNAQTLDKIEIPAITPVSAEMRDFLSAISDDHEPMTDGSFALEVYRVIEKLTP